MAKHYENIKEFIRKNDRIHKFFGGGLWMKKPATKK